MVPVVLTSPNSPLHLPLDPQSLGITEAVQQLEVTAADVRPARAQPAPRKRKMYEIEVG